MRLPDFLILGANKAGTTSLAYYCSQHPEIFFSPVKEPMFFTRLQGEDASRRDATLKKPFFSFLLRDYLKLFSNATQKQMLGEASTAYLANPNCAVWIRKIIPDAKLIAVLRNPIDRALSCYKMYHSNGVEKRTFEEAIQFELQNGTKGIPQGQQYLKLGLYASQLKSFLSFFPRKQLRLLDYEKFNKDSVNFIAAIFNFLGVCKFVPKDLQRKNVATSHYAGTHTNNMFACSDRLRNDMIKYFRKDIELLNTIVDFDAMRWLNQ